MLAKPGSSDEFLNARLVTVFYFEFLVPKGTP
jgi:hypothetical protein